MTVWHASCTCKMGKVDDPDAVVDSKARVIGVTGLRVVDASSFALLPPGHPQVGYLLSLRQCHTNLQSEYGIRVG
jgi:choline dehydrogenase-like flavoprotein